MKIALKFLLIAATWLATAWVAYGLVMANCKRESLGFGGGFGSLSRDYSQGWPLCCREYTEVKSYTALPTWTTKDDRWYLLPVLTNVSCAVLMLGATAVCGIRWQRKPGFQFTLRGLFVLLTIAAGLLAIYERWSFWGLTWPVIAPLMAGVASAIYWICWGVFEGAGFAARKIGGVPASAPHPGPLPGASGRGGLEDRS